VAVLTERGSGDRHSGIFCVSGKFISPADGARRKLQMDTFVIGLFLAATNTKLIDFLAAPVRQRFPQLDLWWLIYIALITGAAISWLAGVNLFGAYIGNEILGRVLSCVLVGGGSSLIHDIFDN